MSDGAYLFFLESVHGKDEALGGETGEGAVVTEVAKDKASDTLVFLWSVIVQVCGDGSLLLNFAPRRKHRICWIA
jgi:hypothetical protein